MDSLLTLGRPTPSDSRRRPDAARPGRNPQLVQGWTLRLLLVSLAAVLCPPALLPAAPAQPQLEFQEVYELLRANLAGATEPELNQAAVLGLIEQLRGRVTLVGESPVRLPAPTNSTPVSASVFDGHFGYIRISALSPEVARQFDETLRGLRSTNKLKGLVLDLRFADGQDYSAAVTLADRFLAGDDPLVDWGEGWKRSSTKTNAISLPLTILVNRRTAGAAEVLAGILRHHELGLLIGTNTAGLASMSREFALKSGQRLRIAVAPVKVAAGQELPFTGMKADIQVDVTPEEELAWYEDAFKVSPKLSRTMGVATNESPSSATNRAARRRLNEAELVRMSREGQTPDRDPFTNAPTRANETPLPVVADPVLARALDLLKGLAVVQQFRSI